jgi:V/A-type H+/Na+-transporting ATPase subunit A
MTLLAADLMNEGFLRQSSFSDVDRYCSPKRQTAMLRLMMEFIGQAEEAVARGISPAKIAAMPILRKLQRLGEEFSESQVDEKPKVSAEIGAAFARLDKQEAAHAS